MVGALSPVSSHSQEPTIASQPGMPTRLVISKQLRSKASPPAPLQLPQPGSQQQPALRRHLSFTDSPPSYGRAPRPPSPSHSGQASGTPSPYSRQSSSVHRALSLPAGSATPSRTPSPVRASSPGKGGIPWGGFPQRNEEGESLLLRRSQLPSREVSPSRSPRAGEEASWNVPRGDSVHTRSRSQTDFVVVMDQLATIRPMGGRQVDEAGPTIAFSPAPLARRMSMSRAASPTPGGAVRCNQPQPSSPRAAEWAVPVPRNGNGNGNGNGNSSWGRMAEERKVEQGEAEEGRRGRQGCPCGSSQSEVAALRATVQSLQSCVEGVVAGMRQLADSQQRQVAAMSAATKASEPALVDSVGPAVASLAEEMRQGMRDVVLLIKHRDKQQQARLFNLASMYDSDSLVALPTDKGYIPGNFPKTRKQFVELSSGETRSLMIEYELPLEPKEDRLERFGSFIGLRLA